MEMPKHVVGRQVRRRETPVRFRYFEDLSGGGVAFTPAACRAWIKCGYQNEELMYRKLAVFSDRAAYWREQGGIIRERMHDWLIRSGLRYSPIDKGLKKAGLDEFWFGGERYSRVHHIKLEDHVPPNRVGRIYFAIDLRNRRWIVDHVGLKLYGV